MKDVIGIILSLKIFTIGFLMLCSPVNGQVVSDSDSSGRRLAIEASYVINFTDYLKWEEDGLSARGTIEIVVFKDAHFYESLSSVYRLKARTMHPLIIREANDLSQVLGADVIYVGKVDNNEMIELTRECKNQQWLLVSNRPGFLTEGGTIALVTENNRLKFRINESLATACGIRISSKLLRLAHANG